MILYPSDFQAMLQYVGWTGLANVLNATAATRTRQVLRRSSANTVGRFSQLPT